MKLSLLEAFLNRKIIHADSELVVRTRAYGIHGSFWMERNVFYVKESQEKLLCRCTETGVECVVEKTNILRIDGMDPIRVAKLFNLHEDGTPKKPRKKRGRKPKK